MMKKATIILAAAGLAACASTPGTQYRPILDTKGGVDTARFEQDLAECQTYAGQVGVAEEAAGGAGVGALVGAATGAAIGAILGDPGIGAAIGATEGGVEGLVEGAGDGVDRRKTVINNCLKHRGYPVLG